MPTRNLHDKQREISSHVTAIFYSTPHDMLSQFSDTRSIRNLQRELNWTGVTRSVSIPLFLLSIENEKNDKCNMNIFH